MQVRPKAGKDCRIFSRESMGEGTGCCFFSEAWIINGKLKGRVGKTNGSKPRAKWRTVVIELLLYHSAKIYPSKGGTPLATYIYDGGHLMDSVEPGLIVKFFQEHVWAE